MPFPLGEAQRFRIRAQVVTESIVQAVKQIYLGLEQPGAIATFLPDRAGRALSRLAIRPHASTWAVSRYL